MPLTPQHTCHHCSNIQEAARMKKPKPLKIAPSETPCSLWGLSPLKPRGGRSDFLETLTSASKSGQGLSKLDSTTSVYRQRVCRSRVFQKTCWNIFQCEEQCSGLRPSLQRSYTYPSYFRTDLEWTDERADGRMDGRTSARTDGRTREGKTGERADGWTCGQAGERTD